MPLRFSAVPSFLAVAFLWLAAPASAAPDNLKPGTRFEFLPGNLARPNATPSVSNPASTVARPTNAGLAVPPGFVATLYAEGLGHPRNLIVAPNGDVILAESRPGALTVLRDADKDGKAEQRFTYVEGVSRPFGLALRPEGLYVADTEAVWRFDYAAGDTKARSTPVRVTPQGALGPGTGHWTRNLVFHPDGDRFYVAIGSAGNIGEEPEPRATIREFRRDGSGGRSFTTGLRNTIGFGFHPRSKQLFAVISERDGLGDDLVPDYLTEVKEGGFYGWPYSYIGSNPQPGLAQKRPDLVGKAIVPDTLFQSHSAPIGMAIYTGTQFPARYRDGFFVALQGSWNSDRPTGYFVAFVPAREPGAASIRPAPHYEVFASGFWVSGSNRATVWGKPAGIAMAPDGALFITDDVGGTIWRVTYRGN